jgi:hypothetical protein
LAALSFWALWIAPLVVGVEFGRLLMLLWRASPAQTTEWGILSGWVPVLYSDLAQKCVGLEENSPHSGNAFRDLAE